MTTTYTCIRCGLTDDSVFNLDGSTAHRELFVCISKLRQHCAAAEAELDMIVDACRGTQMSAAGIQAVRELANKLTAVEAERDHWMSRAKAERIIAALREPSAVVSEAGSRHYRTDDVIRAAVAAAEEEVEGE